MKYFFLVCLVVTLTLAPSVRAQSSRQGSKSELRGVKKIFIDTGQNSKDRERILDVLWENAKDIPGVEVVDRRGDADVWLYFESTRRDYYDAPAPRDPDRVEGKRPQGHPYRTAIRGFGLVTMPDRMGGIRKLMSFDRSRDGLREDWPARQFAKEFVKAWVKANK
jgi:hypothetical protein